ncbi:MAG: DUF452 family protein [Candidatus Gastranaerophilales bacterium]|nr:DUF452 family protein [Candidatus Gastranaerophilales bacterium]
MNSKWLIKNKSKKLIIFFNGWSLDENIVNTELQSKQDLQCESKVGILAHQQKINNNNLIANQYKHINSSQNDVLMFNNYANLEISDEILTEINNYEEKNIISWSFGVWACSKVISKFGKVKKVVAINGTLIPIHNNFGIPEKIFNLTLSGLSEKTYPKFFKNMFLDFDTKFYEGLPKRNIEDQRQELIQIQKQSSDMSRQTQYFNKIFIGMEDKIIPAKNQINFWDTEKNIEIVQLNQGHYIFELFKTWEEILA